MLYFFNFVNIPFQGTQDGDTKKKVAPELLPRALFWFRWGAAWTWATGVLLLLIVFYHGGGMFEPDSGWGRAGQGPEDLRHRRFRARGDRALPDGAVGGLRLPGLQHPRRDLVRHDHGL